jgi:hypothetical protein
MDIKKAQRRDRKRVKRVKGMQVDGRSIFLTQEIQKRKSEEIKREREEKEKLLVDES